MLTRRLRAIGRLSAQDEMMISTLRWDVVDIPPRTDFINEGDIQNRCCLLMEGVVVRSNFTRSGERQIQSVHIPGDMPDLQSLHLQRMDHYIGSVSHCRVGFVTHESMLRVLDGSPKLTATFWRETLIDASLYRAIIVRNARLGSTERLAHFICEMWCRFHAVGLTDRTGFAFTMTQEMVGQVLGLSIVSVNRSMQILRSEGLMVWDRGRIDVLNWSQLADLAQFDPSFLHLND
ncbi:Crp/Fnr family transcriptional regulator [Aureimonas sp. AU20]|uniref:Crp/Fnr family transcriptional regulator n=1 Tax=Aureimonas sp. AU20 TaxID=1349819 RepID=UPI0011DFBE1A|nr:Crp/Fnr family transcriptional regulator [Aureimonas sp. AU20]